MHRHVDICPEFLGDEAIRTELHSRMNSLANGDSNMIDGLAYVDELSLICTSSVKEVYKGEFLPMVVCSLGHDWDGTGGWAHAFSSCPDTNRSSHFL